MSNAGILGCISSPGSSWPSRADSVSILAMPKRQKHVVCSLYANPLHSGHLDYLEAASALGRLTVIVNSDAQVALKASVPFMDQEERARILRALRCVNRVLISVDTDRSICSTLRFLHSIDPVDIFANGGDVDRYVCLEYETCLALGIETVFGVGGTVKTQSSSALLARAKAIG